MEDYLDKAYNKFKNVENNYNNTDAYNYIKNIVSSTSIVFDSSISINDVTKAIYENLLYENYTDYDILKNKCNEKIIKYITNKEFNIKFNKEFNDIYDYTRNATYNVFNTRIQNIRNENYNVSAYYNDRIEKNKIAFSVAFNIYSKKLNVEDLYKSGELNLMINERINIDTFKKNSISKKSNNKAIYDNKKYNTVDYDTIKKFAIGMLILFGIAGISYKKNDTNKTTYVPPKNQYVEQRNDDEENLINSINRDEINEKVIQEIIKNSERYHVRGEN